MAFSAKCQIVKTDVTILLSWGEGEDHGFKYPQKRNWHVASSSLAAETIYKIRHFERNVY